MASLDDAFYKLNRGKEHVSQFLSNIKLTLDQYYLETGIKSKPYTKPSNSTDPRSWEAFTIYCPSIPFIDKKDEILLGEALQSFRSSLDYLAWAWVAESAKKSGVRLKKQQEKKVMFPMSSTAKAFKGNVGHLLPNVSANQRAFIRLYQPYRRSDAGRAMRYLNTLSNTDKHRIIVPALMSPQVGDVEFKINPSLECVKEIHHLSVKREINAGTKIITVVLAGSVPPNQPSVHVDTKLILMPMLPKSIVGLTPSRDIILVEDALTLISTICTEILTKAKERF